MDPSYRFGFRVKIETRYIQWGIANIDCHRIARFNVTSIVGALYSRTAIWCIILSERPQSQWKKWSRLGAEKSGEKTTPRFENVRKALIAAGVVAFWFLLCSSWLQESTKATL